MTRNRKRPAALGEVYREIIERMPGHGRLKEGLALYYWPRVAGKELQEKARAERVKNGILWVKCPDPAFSYNLNFFKKEIIKKYRRILGSGVIRSVRIVTGEIEILQYNEGKKGFRKSVLMPRQEDPPPEIKVVEDSGLKKAYIRFYNICRSLKKENPVKAVPAKN